MVPELLLRELRKCEAPPDDPPSTATALAGAPATALAGAPATAPCGPCAEEDTADRPVEGIAHGSAHGSAQGSADEAPEVPTTAPDGLAKLCADFVQYMRRDQRFEVEGVESGALVTALVRFRLLGWYSVAGDTLTAELREAVNRRGHGVSWLASCHVAPVTAPSEGTSHTLVLMQPLCGGHAEEALHRWADVQRAAEGVMMSHLGEIVCGGCDCLETLAGKVLT
jgi:hypothetical protein